jgi:hypothetical protein
VFAAFLLARRRKKEREKRERDRCKKKGKRRTSAVSPLHSDSVGSIVNKRV